MALAEDVTWPRNSVRSVAAALQSLGVAGRMDASLANGLWQVHILINKRDQSKRPVRAFGLCMSLSQAMHAAR